MIDLTELDSLWFPSLKTMIVCEPGSLPETQGWHWSERHLHCLWADDRLRPAKLRNSRDEPISIVDCGRWNLEAGPDFLNAIVKVGKKTLKGDVEIHIRPSDWNTHHHMNDPRYANVILHVTWFPAENGNIPSHIMSVSLQESVLAMKKFSFDAIDLAAYPHAMIPTTPRPCGLLMAGATQTEVKALLESAGKSRLRRKSLRFVSRLQATGDRYQVFYEEFAAALGYKPNAQGMRAVAEQMPLVCLQESPDFLTRYAKLLGVAGLLPAPSPQKKTSTDHARLLWDIAWKLGVADAPDKPHWVTTGLRPANHPKQRLATLAALFAPTVGLLDKLDHCPREDAQAWVKAVSYTIRSVLQASAIEVGEPYSGYLKIGDERIHTILSNVIIPLFAAEDTMTDNLYRAIPGEALNEQIAEAAFRLLGRDHNPALYQTSGLRMQGLLEIWNGFCLSTKTQCADCRLVEALRRSSSTSKART